MNGNDIEIIEKALSKTKKGLSVFFKDEGGKFYALSQNHLSSTFPYRPVNEAERETIMKQGLFSYKEEENY